VKKHKVTICTGTACFVMGGSELLLLEEQLPGALKEITELEGVPCLEICKQGGYGNTRSDHAPFVLIDGEILEEANGQKIISRLETLEKGARFA
jgi:NADH:ubiquinone oxidoreductase subunit E